MQLTPSFRRRRVQIRMAGLGGQFAKGGGRVPASPTGTATQEHIPDNAASFSGLSFHVKGG